MFSMLSELQETINKKGGSQEMEEEKVTLEETVVDNQPAEEPTPAPETTPETDPVETPEGEFEKKKKDEEEDKETPDNNEGGNTEEDKGNEEDDEDKKKKKNYNLEEVTEYTELKAQYDELQNKYSALEQENANLSVQVEALKEFKLVSERKDKQDMIDSFYMLSDEEKKDVIEHMDTYSLETIEAKLSVICVRNKLDLSFKADEGKDNDSAPAGLFSLEQTEETDVPAWIKAVQEFSK